MFAYYNRAAFLNAMEVNLTSTHDVEFLREHRIRILDESNDAQNADQMAAIASHLLDPHYVVNEAISPSEHERVERRVSRCRAVAHYVANEWVGEEGGEIAECEFTRGVGYVPTEAVAIMGGEI